MVRSGQPIAAAEVNEARLRLAALGIHDAQGVLRHLEAAGTVLTMPTNAQMDGGLGRVGETGGLRLPCENRDPRPIPAYSVVEIDGINTNPLAPTVGSWPLSPGVFVRRPNAGPLWGKAGWVDERISGNGMGTVIVGGIGVVWTRRHTTVAPVAWGGSYAAYAPNPGFNWWTAACGGSFRLQTVPAGDFMALWLHHYAEDASADSLPGGRWHDEIAPSDYYDRWIAVVVFRTWWA